MLSDKEKYKVLNRILDSNTFNKTTTTSILLKLLVESTIQEKELSAYSVGLELFGTQIDSEKLEVNTRVNISHLRKKLKKYYETEGINDPVQISIEPGQYKVTFSTINKSKTITQKTIITTSIITILIISSIIYSVISPVKDRVWAPVFSNNLETSLYLGEVFGYKGMSHFGAISWTRDFRINSEKEFFEYKMSDPEKYKNLKPATYNYIVVENAVNIKPFTQYFTQNNHDFFIHTSSAFSTKLLKEQNSIFAGPLSVKSPFNDLFNEFSKNVKITPAVNQSNRFLINYSNSKLKKDTIFDFKGSITGDEHALAASFKGPNNSQQYMFFSNHGMGLSAIVEYFTNPDSLADFSKKNLQNSDEFISIFYITGKDRTSLDMNMVLFDDNK